jgi:cobalt/nickel transport system permease protein
VHHLIIDEWARRDSPLHRRDARVKLVALMIFLISAGTTDLYAHKSVAALGVVAVAAAVLGRLPLIGVLKRALVVLPFTAAFASMVALSGDMNRAGMLVARSYLSAVAVLVVVGTTPLPALINGLERLGCPRFLALVVHFINRYLIVIGDEAARMRMAALARGGRGWRFRQAAGALAVLFGRSFARAEGIHRAMVARGFTGRFPTLTKPHTTIADGVFLLAAITICLSVRLVF